MGRRLNRARDAAIEALWARVSRLGTNGRRRLSNLWGAVAGRLPNRALDNWARNVEQATGTKPTPAQRRQAGAWWLRNLLESVTLEHWSADEITDAVLISDDDWARLQASFNGPGAVLALGHLGSWDLCGAWVSARGMPVSSVAERLPDARFEKFLDARRAVGMTIRSLDEPALMERLVADVAEGRLVCLLADRDLRGGGVGVVWPGRHGGRAFSVPPGPAALARRTGADLMTVTSGYESDKMRIRIGQPIRHQPGPDGLAAMMQEVVNDIAAAVASSPADWHVMGRFFR